MRNNLLASVLLGLVCLLLAPATAFASHYPLDESNLFPESELKALKAQGYTDTEALGAALLKAADRKAMAKKTGLEEKRVDELAEICDLLRIRGVGPKMVSLLRLSGIYDSSDLGKAVPEQLHERMRQANDIHAVSELVPEVDILKGWIEDAKKNPSPLK